MYVHCKLHIFKFLHSVIPASQLLEIVRWNYDDAIAHGPLRMRITNLTKLNSTKSEHFTTGMSSRIWWIENGWTEIHQILYGGCAIGHCTKLVLSDFLHSVTPWRRTLKVARWNDDDAIAHASLRMRITNVTEPHPTQPNEIWALYNWCVFTCLINREWLDGNSWNFVWTLCHRSRLQTHTFWFFILCHASTHVISDCRYLITRKWL
jgi:hypothetical protein